MLRYCIPNIEKVPENKNYSFIIVRYIFEIYENVFSNFIHLNNTILVILIAEKKIMNKTNWVFRNSNVPNTFDRKRDSFQ